VDHGFPDLLADDLHLLAIGLVDTETTGLLQKRRASEPAPRATTTEVAIPTEDD
jgi:hypothetical protein